MIPNPKPQLKLILTISASRKYRAEYFILIPIKKEEEITPQTNAEIESVPNTEQTQPNTTDQNSVNSSALPEPTQPELGQQLTQPPVVEEPIIESDQTASNEVTRKFCYFQCLKLVVQPPGLLFFILFN